MPRTVTTSSGVTSGEASPHPLKTRPRTAKACDMPVALKNTQPRQTNWKVRNRCTQTRTGPSATGGSPRRSRLVRRRCPKLCPTPCRAPQITNVHAAPCHRPPSTMVIMMLRTVCASAVRAAAERDVEVVAQPARQRHVPAAPEVLQVARRVGRVEVLREAEAEQQGEADGDVGVAAEVAVDLHRVAPGGEDRLGRRVLGGRREDRRDDRARDVGGDHDLLEQAGQDQPEGAGVVDGVRRRGGGGSGAAARCRARSGRPGGAGRTRCRPRSRAAWPARARDGRCRPRS